MANEESYITTKKVQHLGNGYARCCGPVAITNLILTLENRAEEGAGVAETKTPATMGPRTESAPNLEEAVRRGRHARKVFREVARLGAKKRIYLNSNFLGMIGGTSNYLSARFIRAALAAAGLKEAKVTGRKRLSGEILEKLYAGAHDGVTDDKPILYLQLMFHPIYGRHHLLCYDAKKMPRPEGAKEDWMLKLADGWTGKPVYQLLSDIGRPYFIEIRP